MLLVLVLFADSAVFPRDFGIIFMSLDTIDI